MKPQFLLSLLIFGGPLIAQSDKNTNPAIAVCAKWQHISLPAEALAGPEPKVFPVCNSYKLYSGSSGVQDFVAARKCAWSERRAMEADLHQNPNDPISWVIGGAVILSEIYANGEGVPKNLPLALRLACDKGANTEPDAILNLSARIENSHADPGRFQYCNHAMSMFTIGFCASYQQEIDDQDQLVILRRLSSQWSPQQQTEFQTLIKLEGLYANAHGGGELDLAGTMRVIYEIDADEELRGDFRAAIESFEQGKFPRAEQKDADIADTELNQIYKKDIVAAEARKSEYGAVQPEGIRAAERAWLKYRDEWLVFATLRYPKVSKESWLTLLTRDRIKVLRATACEVGDSEYSCPNLDENPRKPEPLP